MKRGIVYLKPFLSPRSGEFKRALAPLKTNRPLPLVREGGGGIGCEIISCCKVG